MLKECKSRPIPLFSTCNISTMKINEFVVVDTPVDLYCQVELNTQEKRAQQYKLDLELECSELVDIAVELW